MYVTIEQVPGLPTWWRPVLFSDGGWRTSSNHYSTKAWAARRGREWARQLDCEYRP